MYKKHANGLGRRNEPGEGGHGGKPSYEDLANRVEELEKTTCDYEQIEAQLLKISYAVEQVSTYNNRQFCTKGLSSV